jgi:hypothetical protein
MNKYFQQGLLSVLVASLVACGGSGGGGGSKSSSPVSSSTPSSVAASSLGESSSSATTASSTPASSVAPSSVAESSVATSVSSSASSEASSSAPSSTATTSSAATSSATTSSSSIASSAPALTGVFLDSAVAGIGYRTSPSGNTGFTSAQGEYAYASDDKVTFYIGDLELPEVDAKGVITPLDLANSDELTNQVALNIAILLQSLDSDGDPSNGISIDYSAAAPGAVAVIFDQPANSFSSAISSLVTAAQGTLVTAEAAQSHLQSTLENLNTLTAERLVGTWYMSGEGYRAALAFLDNTHYISIEVTEDEGTNIEVGSYEWNAATGAIIATVDGEAGNTDLGLKPAQGHYLLTIAGDQLLISEENDTEAPTPMTKLSSEAGLTGGWYIADQGMLALAVFTGSEYLLGQYAPNPEDQNGQSGVEYGTYNYSPNTREFTLETLIDSNGQWGFSHPCAVLDTNGNQWQASNDLSCGPNGANIIQTLTRNGTSLTFVSQADTLANGGEEQPVSFVAVGASAGQDSIELEVTVTNTVTQAVQGELFTAPGASMRCGASEFDTVGESETFPETWVINPNYGQASYVTDEKYVNEDPYSDTGTFDPVFNKLRITNAGAKINLCAAGEAQCEGDVIFYGHNSYTWTANINLDPQAEPLAIGEIVETRKLSWNLGPEVSVCTVRYNVTATRLPPP